MLESITRKMRQEKEIKGIQIGKEDINLFASDMILYLNDPKNSTRILLDLINNCSKAGYKTNIEKSVGFLHTNKHAEKKIGKQSS
jgi:hypothetical protein